MMKVLNQVLQQATQPAKDAVLGKHIRGILTKNGGVDFLSEQYKMLAAYHGNNYLQLL